MTKHSLKSLPDFFWPVRKGVKQFEIRFNDRDYKVGDTLLLREWSEKTGYTGSECLRVVTYVTDFQQKDNFVVMGIKVL